MLKRSLWGFLALVLVGCASRPVQDTGPGVPDSGQDIKNAQAADQVQVQLPDLGQAPELQNEIWLNTDGPLRLADLQGQVVLLEMWTFG